MKHSDEEEVVTKGYLRKVLYKQKNEICFELRTEIDVKFAAFFESLKDWKDEILRGNDKVIQKFDTFEKEHASIQLNYVYLKDDIEELQTRVIVLEKKA